MMLMVMMAMRKAWGVQKSRRASRFGNNVLVKVGQAEKVKKLRLKIRNDLFRFDLTHRRSCTFVFCQ